MRSVGDEPRQSLFGSDVAQGPALHERMPLFVDMRRADCLVVGAGTVGMRRARALASFGACVTVCDPAFPAADELEPNIRSLGRGWQPGDERGRALVCAATNSREVNHEISEACRAALIPVSASDDPADCTFYFPAICRSPRLTAGVVSHGAEHSLVAAAARAVRGVLAEADAGASQAPDDKED